MRILFIHEVGYFEKPLFEMHEFPESLAALGHEVGFVEFQEENSSEVKDAGSRIVHGRLYKHVRLKLYSQTSSIPGIAGRLVAATKFFGFFRRVLKEFRPDIVVCYSVPTSGWQAQIVASRLGIPFIYRALDVSHKIRKTAFEKFVLLAERFIYQRADWVSANNPALLSYCRSLGASEARSSVELPPIQISHFHPSSKGVTSMRRELHIPNSARVIVFMGTFFYFSGLHQMVKDFLAAEVADTYLVLVGGGELEHKLRHLVSNHVNGSNVVFTGFVPYEKLPDYLALADIAVNPMEPGLVSHSAFPNKVIQYMASSLPVVSTDLDGLRLTFPGTPGLNLVPRPGNVIESVVRVLQMPDLEKLGQTCKESVSRVFTTSATIGAFESLVERVGSRY